MVRFWSLIRQTLCSRAYMILQLRLFTSTQFLGVIDPKTPIFGKIVTVCDWRDKMEVQAELMNRMSSNVPQMTYLDVYNRSDE